ncbi:HIRAN domain-containing protein [Litchfieldella xinjiangensis]|uniref:HIRAN domain-containing protein n=1 Tax=Litchfieldella xinjiangensis TaxID=1166948 RepID=UPI0005B878D8|nr:HIRAN domain-containing protein [Halomonas xinjiangensis]
MAKFETRVAGVSFYNVNFSAVSLRSKVTLSPDPKNPHDVNGIKVIIDGHHVGHIPRSLNVTLNEYIERQYNVGARVASVTSTELSDIEALP